MMHTQAVNQTVLRLQHEMTFQTPPRWQVHARYALESGGAEIRLPAGTWLLALGPVAGGSADTPLYAFRTTRGQVLLRAGPLPEGAARRVRDPEAARAMQAYRDLAAILQAEYGLSFAPMCPSLPPFALIRCPLCRGTRFTTVDFASAWCERCNAAFFVRATAGDPGFVVDVLWEHYDPAAADYILPRTRTLRSTLVLKDSRDPRDLDTSDCLAGCQAGALQRTDGTSGLRAGLHACQIGTLYDWRSLYGEVPRPEDLEGGPLWNVDGQLWPGCATLRVLPLSTTERQALDGARYQLGKTLPHTAAILQALLAAQHAAPAVLSAPLPDVGQLQEGERYLLHHWLLQREARGARQVEIALPVWYVVAPDWQAHRLTGWRVLRRNICPNCGAPVAAGQDQLPSDAHRACRAVWHSTGWQPLFAEDAPAGADPAAGQALA